MTGYDELLVELFELHLDKSSTYGTGDDPFANFMAVGAVAAQPAWRYPMERVVEKAVRALNMVDAGQDERIEEFLDIASLAVCAEVLRRRWLATVAQVPGGDEAFDAQEEQHGCCERHAACACERGAEQAGASEHAARVDQNNDQHL